MTNHEQEEYKKKGFTVWVVSDVDNLGSKVHMLKGNERFIFDNEEALAAYVQDIELGLASRVAWEPYKGTL